MAIKTISQFPSGIPADNDYILFEQNGEGKSAKFSDFSLSYGEIMATNPVPDLSGKVSSAEALKTLGDSSYCEHVVTENSGEYWRFASGLQICILEKDFGKQTFNSWGSVYYYDIPSIDFPAPFVSSPYVATVSTSTCAMWGGVSGSQFTNETSWKGIRIYRPTEAVLFELSLKLIAIGRWK